MGDEPLEHEQHLWAAGHVGVDGEGDDAVVLLPVDPVELVAPHLLDLARVDEAVGVGAALDEHHRGQVVEVPVRRDFDEVGLLAADQRLHPVVCAGQRVVDRRPLVADPDVVRLEVAVHERVVVLDAALEEQLVGDAAELPPRGDVPGGAMPRHLLDQRDALIEDLGLLLAGHRDRVLVGVTVYADLVARLDDHAGLLGEGLHRVTGDEPGGAQVVAAEQLEQARHPDLTGEQAAADVVGGVLPAVGAEPAGDGVNVDAERADDFFVSHR